MKKIKSMLFTFSLVFMLMFIVAGCGNKTTKKPITTKTSVVKVQSIKGGEEGSIYIDSTPIRMAKLNSVQSEIKLAEENKSAFNYFVIVKSKHQLSITVTVENPMAVQIDMVKLASDDEAAKVKTYVNQTETWQTITEQPVVGWNGSNVYKTSWDIETTKDTSEVTFTVTDFKVNGAWQQEEDLGNNVLHVYKIEDDDIQLQVLSNGFNGQVNNSVETFKVLNNNENIIIKSVILNSEALTADENGVYTITENTNDSYMKSIYVKYTFKLGDTGMESEELTTSAYYLNLARLTGEYLLTMNFDELLLSIHMSGDNITPTYTYYLNGTEISSTGTIEKNDVIYEVIKNSSWTGIDDARNAIANMTVKINNIIYNLAANDGELIFTISAA